LVDKRWIQDIAGTLTVAALSEYLLLWQIIDAVQLQPGVEDAIKWKWTTMFFQGSERFEGDKPIWKAWPPLKVKFFTWLAVRKRIWTADRRHRHGLQGPTVRSSIFTLIELRG
jgi:hypothetical protein